MKKLVVLLMAMLVASVAFAQIDPDTNMMGVYFDTGANETCLEGLAPNSFVTAYICLVNPDFANIKGFECTMTVNGSIFAQAPVFPDGGLNVGSGDNYLVGFNQIPAEPVNILMSLPFLAFGGPITFDLGPSVPSSGALGLPMVAIVDSEGLSSLVYTGYTTADGIRVASINDGGCTVDTETVSFDGIKSLYR
jgi:hypothetical protein